MIQLGRLGGQVKVYPWVDLHSDLAVWQEVPEFGALGIKIQLSKAYPVAVNP